MKFLTASNRALLLLLVCWTSRTKAIDPFYQNFRRGRRRGFDHRNISAASFVSFYHQRRPVQRRRRASQTGLIPVVPYSEYVSEKEHYRPWKQVRYFHRRHGQASWTNRIMALTIFMHMAETFNPRITKLGMKLSHPIRHGRQLHRLITPMFLHASPFHLGTNMVSLSRVGEELERFLGGPLFLATYAIAGISGNVMSAVKSPNPSLGASGAVFGVMAGYFVVLQRNGGLLGEDYAESMSDYLGRTMIGNLAMGMFLRRGRSGNRIDHWAHLGGALGGAAIAWACGPQISITKVPQPDGSVRRLLINRPILRMPLPIEWVVNKWEQRIQRQEAGMDEGERRHRRLMRSDRSVRPRRT